MVFNTALSGIQASGKDLEIIGNNIANASTIGFKGSRSEFSDIYTSSAYGSGNNSVGAGVKLSRVQQSFSSGNLTPTSNTLDLAISGSGFFIVEGATTGRVYTRAGRFKLDEQNYIVNGSNQRLVGLQADATGTITGLQDALRVNTANIPPKPTGTVSIGVNLNSNLASTDLISQAWDNTAPPALPTSPPLPSPSTYNNITSSTIYDSLGNAHVLSIYFIKANGTTGGAVPAANGFEDNQWFMGFKIDGEEVQMTAPASASTDPNTAKLPTVNFNPDGTLVGVRAAGVTAAPATEVNTITIAHTLRGGGADPFNFTIDFGGSTQFGSPFAVQTINNDGYTAGSLVGLAVNESGIIAGRYTNGQSLNMGQIQLANFPDLEGLKSLGNTGWAETLASGQPVTSAAGGGGMGSINSGALEESNVDITSQLVALINAQRNFQANAQTIRTADSIAQTIINIR